MTIAHLIANTAWVGVTGASHHEVKGITHHSGKVKSGYVFVAIQGYERNGEDFIWEAVRRGATAVVSERPCPLPDTVSLILVPSARGALADMSATFHGHPSTHLRVVGVTSTNGKTTTTFFLDSILRHAGYRTGLIGTVHYRVGDRTLPSARTTPESVDLQGYLREMVDTGTHYAVMEVSAHSVSLDRVRACDVDVGVFTNLSLDHLNFYKTPEDYREAKIRFFQGLGKTPGNKGMKYACINVDDPASRVFLQSCTVPVVTFGTGEAAVYRMKSLGKTASGFRCILRCPGGELPVETEMPGRFNLYNAVAASTVALKEGIPPCVVREGVSKMRSVPGRCRILDAHGAQVWVDFAHNPEALRNVLQAARQHSAPRRIILVTGCEGHTDRDKRRKTGEVAARYSDFTFVTTDNVYHDDPSRILEEIEGGLRSAGKLPGLHYATVMNRYEAIRGSLKMAGRRDLVLVAGKGPERYWVVGDDKVPFDDEQVVREILAGDTGHHQSYLSYCREPAQAWVPLPGKALTT